MSRFKNIFIFALSGSVILGVGVGIFYAFQSDLFTVKSVEVRSSLESPPLSTQAILKMAAVPTGRASLFQLDLKGIEKRLLTSEWIHHVNIQVKPRDTLSIFITYRNAKALLQSKKGTLSLVDASGKVYGNVNLVSVPDLPIFSGFSEQTPEQLVQGLKLLEEWEHSGLSAVSSISSISWDEERGFRAVIFYAMKKPSLEKATQASDLGRAMVDFGTDVVSGMEMRLSHLANVFRYLGEQGVAVRQVWADVGKKIVVKTSRGS